MRRFFFNNYVLGTFFGLLLISCSNKPTEKVIHQRLVSGEFDAYHHLPVLQLSQLQKDTLGIYYFEEEVYSGVAEKFYPNSKLLLEKIHLFKGELHGYHLFYGPQADTLLEVLFNEGKALKYRYNKFKLVQNDSIRYADSSLVGTYLISMYTHDSIHYKLESRFFEGLLSCITVFNEVDSLLTEFEPPEHLFKINDTVVPFEN